METIEQPAVLAMPFANNGTKNSLPTAATGTGAASLAEGFPLLTSTSITDNGVPPSRADMNGLGYVSTAYAYLMQCGGVYTYRDDVATTIGGYPLNALLWYIPTNGIPNLLRSSIANNTNNFNEDSSVIGEEGSGKPWEIVTVTPTNFVTTNTSQTITGAKTFSTSPQVPTAASGDSSTKAASTEFVTTADSNLQTQINTKANSSDVVNLTGTQTIPGAKTLQTAYIQSTTLEYDVAPSENTFKWLRWIDKNGEVMGVVEVNRTLSNATHMQLNVRGATGDYAGPALGIVMEANGDVWAQAPQGGHYNDSIVTTVQYVSNSAGEAWVLGNGLTIQKGISSVDNNQVTLPTPFKSTNYVVCATYHKTGSHGSGIGHICTYNNYTNSFYANTEGGEYQWIAIGY